MTEEKQTRRMKIADSKLARELARAAREELGESATGPSIILLADTVMGKVPGSTLTHRIRAACELLDRFGHPRTTQQDIESSTASIATFEVSTRSENPSPISDDEVVRFLEGRVAAMRAALVPAGPVDPVEDADGLGRG